jgi:hypothetical protein
MSIPRSGVGDSAAQKSVDLSVAEDEFSGGRFFAPSTLSELQIARSCLNFHSPCTWSSADRDSRSRSRTRTSSALKQGCRKLMNRTTRTLSLEFHSSCAASPRLELTVPA